MFVACSDIHVLGSLLMSAEATRMQDLASEFSKKKFRAWHLRTPTGRGRPPPAFTTSPARARGASAPVLGQKPWSHSTFQPWLRPWCWDDYQPRYRGNITAYRNTAARGQFSQLYYRRVVVPVALLPILPLPLQKTPYRLRCRLGLVLQFLFSSCKGPTWPPPPALRGQGL